MPEVKASPATPDKSLSHSRCNLVTGTEKITVSRINPPGRFSFSFAALLWGVRSGKLGGTLSSGASSLEGTAKQFYGTGRRRESIARVYIKQGAARFTVNGRPVDEYFRNVAWNTAAVEPLKFTQMLDQVEVKCIVKGGGVGGQSGAVRMGLSRALSRLNPELRPALRKNGFLTRDPRMKERKKYGQKGARRRFQFSKR
jgi:small subunit ribosomal protein S9